MPKYVLREATSGGEISELFEANSREEALEHYLKSVGETFTEVKEEEDKEERIIVSIEGGLVSDVKIPSDCKTIIEIRDYDVEGADIDDICKDDEGGEYRVGEWGN